MNTARTLRTLHLGAALASALPLLAACTRAPAPEAPSSATARPSATTKPTSAAARLEEMKALALAAPDGTSPLDLHLRGLEEKVRHDPAKADSWVLLGRAWVQKARQSADPGFYLHADACAELALALKTDYPLALSLRGLVLMNDHRFAEAKALAERILTQDPDDLMTYGVLSDAELELGNFDAAVVAAQRMVDLKPSLPSYSRAAYLRWLSGDATEAKRIMWLAIDAGRDQRDPEPGAWALVEAAKLFFHEGDYAGADVGFDRALLRFRDHPPALLGKARVALALGRPVNAADYARRSFEGSRLAEAAWVWGDAERAAGHLDRAKVAFDRVVALGRQGDRRTLAAFYATEDRDLEEARHLIEAELQHRGDTYTHDAHAWVLHRLGRDVEAKAASDRALAHGTKDALLLFHAGAIRLALGETAEGLAQLRAALHLSPKFHPTAAAEAQRLLAARGV